jgi:hypothetical protein
VKETTGRRPVDLDDTTFCPRRPQCEGCGAVRQLDAVTAAAGSLGVLCLTLCPSCLPPRMPLPASAAGVAEHCEHLGIDLDEMVEAMEATR